MKLTYDELFSRLGCAITHDIDVCGRCGKCGKDAITARIQLHDNLTNLYEEVKNVKELLNKLDETMKIANELNIFRDEDE